MPWKRGGENSLNGLAGDAVGLDILKAKRQLVEMIRSVLKLEVLSSKTRTKLLETLPEFALLYGLSIIVHQKVHDKKVKAVQNAARRIMLGLHNRRLMSVQALAEEVHLRNLSAQLQKRRLNFWASLHKSGCKKLGKPKRCYAKSRLRQLRQV
ncbi:hypothetical protein ACTXT7_017150 [Hymenolepis weldensis]